MSDAATSIKQDSHPPPPLANRPILKTNIVLLLVCISIAFLSSTARPKGEGGGQTASPYAVSGWPVILGNKIQSTAAVADIDGDGRDELAVGLRDGMIFLLNGSGEILPGWPRAASNQVYYSPILADLDGDGRFEVTAVSQGGFVHSWGTDGTPVSGWPVDLGSMPTSSPVPVPIPGTDNTAILISCRYGDVHLLDHNGMERDGWPKPCAGSNASRNGIFPIASCDLIGEAQPKLLCLSRTDAILCMWDVSGKKCPGFPRTLGGKGVGIAVFATGDSARIACTTRRALFILDTDGRILRRMDLHNETEIFSASPVFIAAQLNTNLSYHYVAAASRQGGIYIWDKNGRLLPGWPVYIGGFIYGVPEYENEFLIGSPPRAWDVDNDRHSEILIGSLDQHLYCFELDGSPVPGWPLTFGDRLLAAPAFAELDGKGRKELVVSQMGEALFAFHLERQKPEQAGALHRQPDLYDSREWPPHYYAIAGAIILMLLLIAYRLRLERFGIESIRRMRRSVLFMLVIIALLVLVRIFFFAGELQHYRQEKKRIEQAEPAIGLVLADAQYRIQRTAEVIAEALSASPIPDSDDPLRILYEMERLADHHRLDYRHTGLVVTDPSGSIIQSLGIARGLTSLEGFPLSSHGASGPFLLRETPVLTAAAPWTAGPDSCRLQLFSSLLNTYPIAIADATGCTAQLRLGGRTLASGGASPGFKRIWPWLGMIEPADEISLSSAGEPSPLTVRLGGRAYFAPHLVWMNLAIVLLLPIAGMIISLKGGVTREARPRLWWYVSYCAIYAIAMILFSRMQLAQRPVSLAGHYLEFSIHLLGLLGFVAAVLALIGPHRGRRLNFALAGSYLIVGLLPLALILFIATVLLQQAQRKVIRETISSLEKRADNLSIAYLGNPKFIRSLEAASDSLLDMPAEMGWFDFVGESQHLFTYDMPSSYLTLRVHDPRDPNRFFTGFSWGAPRREKFYSELPGWIGESDIKGLFLDRGDIIVRAVRPIRYPKLKAHLISHIPIDESILEYLEARLRILPFLPRVRLLPVWRTPTGEPDLKTGWYPPFSTNLTIPVQDWRTGAHRFVVFRANAFLPPGPETWTALSTMIFLVLLPFALSIWGAWFTFRRTVRPLNRLLTGIRRVEMGNLEYRLADTGESEIALAGRAFDRMADSLKTKVQELVEKKKVEEVSELKSHFISMVSHDLKTPLSSIKGATENILEELAGPVTERQRSYLQMILSSSNTLQQMIADLLDLSRIESGHVILELEKMDIRREAENMLRSVQPLLDELKLETEISVTAGDTIVEADRTRLWQIFNNIISNAVHYSPPGGLVSILIADAPDPANKGRTFLKTTITDQGPGIPGGEDIRLFEPFYAKPVGPRGRQGAGLGLAIVKNLVELHGGEVHLVTAEKGGAACSFTLPKSRANTAHL